MHAKKVQRCRAKYGMGADIIFKVLRGRDIDTSRTIMGAFVEPINYLTFFHLCYCLIE